MRVVKASPSTSAACAHQQKMARSTRRLERRAFICSAGCSPSQLWDLLEQRLPVSSITCLAPEIKNYVWTCLCKRSADVQFFTLVPISEQTKKAKYVQTKLLMHIHSSPTQTMGAPAMARASLAVAKGCAGRPGCHSSGRRRTRVVRALPHPACRAPKEPKKKGRTPKQNEAPQPTHEPVSPITAPLHVRHPCF